MTNRRIKERIKVIALLIASSGFAFKPAAAAGSESILPGDYRTELTGSFRRLLISPAKSIKYEIWQIDEGGRLKHEAFDLLSPKLVESNHYLIINSSGRHCGFASLTLYRNNGEIQNGIIVLVVSGSTQPMASTGSTPTTSDLREDDAEVAKIKTSIGNPHLYDHLGALEKSAINGGFPICSS